MTRTIAPMVATALALLLGLHGAAAHALGDAELAARVARRLHGDRSGACMAVALVDRQTATAYVCADAQQRRVDANTAFEIGSVSKTFMGTLLAQQVLAGKLKLDDPLSDLLPAGAKVPGVGGNAITLRHVVTHTAGLPVLPSRMVVRDPADPYAGVTAQQLLDSLAEVVTDRPPGTEWAYSNFGGMLLSLALSRHLKQDFDAAATTLLLAPLGMRSTYTTTAPAGVRASAGHASNGRVVPPWRIPAELSGVGGFRSTLPDMVRYVQAHLGRLRTPLDAALALSRQPAATAGGQQMGLGWFLSPLLERRIAVHEGHTGGFSSLVAIDPGSGRGVVVLSDTSFMALGGLGGVGLPLLDDRLPLLGPRKPAAPDTELLDGLVGRYRLDNGQQVSVLRNGPALELRVSGQPVQPLGYDSTGDFYGLFVDGVLRPVARPGDWAFVWMQGGAVQVATRVDAPPPRPAPDKADAARLDDYTGTYQLLPGLAVRIRVEDGRLTAQVGRQKPAELQRVLNDYYVTPETGAELRFVREAGKVVALNVRQGGNDLYGERR